MNRETAGSEVSIGVYFSPYAMAARKPASGYATMQRTRYTVHAVILSLLEHAPSGLP